MEAYPGIKDELRGGREKAGEQGQSTKCVDGILAEGPR